MYVPRHIELFDDVHIQLTRHITGPRRIFVKLLKAVLARSSEVGSRTLIHAALGGTQKEMQGKYLTTCKVDEESDYALSPEGMEVQERIWVRLHDHVTTVYDANYLL